MKIAILGTRGIPARYGGFETFAEQLSKRLAEQGHEVAVYCRRSFVTPADKIDARIRRVILPTVRKKCFDTLFHTFLSTIHVLFTDAEVVLFCNVGNSLFAWIPRLFGKPTILNVDGLDRKRKKWNFLGRAFLLFCEVLATFTPSRLVTDAKVIQDYYWRRYRKRSMMIAYGAEVPADSEVLQGFDLPKGRYLLYVSRFEPENNPELVIRAYRQVRTDWPLVIAGGNPYDGFYVHRLRWIADPRVVFLGPVYGDGYWQLQRNAGIYICASEVGGTHPGLLEAMAARNCILYLDTPENCETVGDTGLAFTRDPYDLAAKMHSVIQDGALRHELAQRAEQRARAGYSWEEVTKRYEQLLFDSLAFQTGKHRTENP